MATPKRKPKQLELPTAAANRIRNLEIAVESLADSIRELESWEGASKVYFTAMAKICGVEDELRQALRDEIIEQGKNRGMA